MKKSRKLQKLNVRQRQAVEFGVTGKGSHIAGPLLIIAGAGTGKTQALAHRVAHLIVNGVDPNRILLMTFTRRASKEMVRRANSIVNTLTKGAGKGTKVKMPWAGTFHAIGTRILRANAHRVGLNPAFTFLDEADAAELMNMARHQTGSNSLAQQFPSKETCLDIYSRKVNSQLSLRTTLKRHFPEHIEWKGRLRQVFKAYVTDKQKRNVIDFDDMLLGWAEMLKHKELADLIGSQFDHVLVDEYQDTNILQAVILKRLKPDGRGLTVIGDDAQAIYGFRGAEASNILEFSKQYEPAATVIKLVRNYRSTQAVLDASNAVIGLAEEGYKKELRAVREGGDKPELVATVDDYAQAAFVVGRVRKNLEDGRALKQQAVLCRNARNLNILEAELARQKIPYRKFGGKKLAEVAHIKDVLAVLRWAENPSDLIASFRAVRLLPGFGAAHSKRVLEALQKGSLSAFKPPSKSTAAWSTLMRLIKGLRSKKPGWPAEVDTVRAWYKPHCERKYENGDERFADLTEFLSIAKSYKTRRELLTTFALDPPSAAGAPEKAKNETDLLTLSTIHSAKGQEWRSVFVINVIDGIMPSSWATTKAENEEERRLLYVAMTRAKDELVLVVPLRAQMGKRASQRTPFIPEAILNRFEQVAHPDGDEVPASKLRGGKVMLNLPSLLLEAAIT